jgi:hypothetical protein
MAAFNYKQLIYAGMVAVAGVNEVVDKKEQKHINKIFDHYAIYLSKKDRKEVISLWESKRKDGFTELFVEELSAFPQVDQAEVHKRMRDFIAFTKHKYLKSEKSAPKGLDPEKAEMHEYEKRMTEIWDKLDQKVKAAKG